MKLLRWIVKRWLCWASIHDIDDSNQGYVGFYCCKRCNKYVEI